MLTISVLRERRWSTMTLVHSSMEFWQPSEWEATSLCFCSANPPETRISKFIFRIRFPFDIHFPERELYCDASIRTHHIYTFSHLLESFAKCLRAPRERKEIKMFSPNQKWFSREENDEKPPFIKGIGKRSSGYFRYTEYLTKIHDLYEASGRFNRKIDPL